jgi:hypothetical protein
VLACKPIFGEAVTAVTVGGRFVVAGWTVLVTLAGAPTCPDDEATSYEAVYELVGIRLARPSVTVMLVVAVASCNW